MSMVFDLSHPSPQQWRVEHHVNVLSGTVVAGLAIIGAWIGVSAEARLTDQYPWFTAGALAVGFSGVLQARWLLAGFASLRTREREVLGAVRANMAPSTTVVEVPTSGELVVIAHGSTRYRHRPECTMVRGKAVSSWDQSDEEHESCQLCES
ncbi:MAG: hypothetical protein M3P04_00185 [Actinomycetota bacterium]|nr:hypothetical protein [Actinomycetota bacterium]